MKVFRLSVAGQSAALLRFDGRAVRVRGVRDEVPGVDAGIEWARSLGRVAHLLDTATHGEYGLTGLPAEVWERRARVVPVVDMSHWFEDEPAVDRANKDLEDFFAQPLAPAVTVVENLRHNPDLDAVFGV